MRGDPLVQPAGQAVAADGAAPVQVPDGFNIFTAQFARAGEDLLLTSADGKSLTIVDYFNAAQPPALVAPNGAMLTGDVVGHLAGPRAPGQYAQDGEPELGESIGRVETLTGTATATRATGETVELRPGQPVFEGDVIETGADTDLALLIDDGTLASMQSNSRLILDELVYEPGGSANSMLVSLVEGAFAFITGAVAGSGGMDVQTPVAVMAIRGTVPIAVVAGDGTTNFFAGSDSSYQLLHLVTGELIAEISSGFGYVLNDPNASLQAYELDPEATETINDLLDTLNEAATSLGLLGVISGQDFVPYSPFGDIDRSDEVVALFEFLELLNETLTEENVASVDEDNNDLLNTGNLVALDDAGMTLQGNTITVDVLANDVDPDPNDPLTLIFATLEPGFFGTVAFDQDAGTVTYDPGTAYDHLAEGESITVPITYAVSNASGEFTSARVNVIVEGSNDSPAISLAGSDSSSAELAETNDPLTTSGTLSVFDIDLSDTVSASVVSVTIAGPDGGAAAGGPAAAQPDVAALLSMMTVNSTVGPGVSDGQIVWHFNSGLHTFDYLSVGETETFIYTVQASDGRLSDSQDVEITVTGTNDDPEVSGPVLATADEDDAGPAAVNLLANASDPDLSDDIAVDTDSVSYAVTSGTWTDPVVHSVDSETGILSFDPQQFNSLGASESVELTFSYNVVDGNGGVTAATAVFTVTGSNDGPTAQADAAITDEDSPVSFSVLANDTDPDTTDVLTVTGAAVSSGQGSVVVGADGSITYDPGQHYQHLAVGESATVEITYDIADGHGGTSSVVATVTVNGVNDAPTAHADAAATDEDSTVSVDVLANDTDPDATDELTVTGASVTSGAGTVTVGADDIITYDPGQAYQHLAVGESATVEITHQIADGNGGTSSAVATVTVTGVNDAPTAAADEATTDEDSAVSINVLANDTDPDTTDSLTVTGAGVTSGQGSVIVGPGGTSIVYDPGDAYQHLAAGESATVEITYQIADGHGGTSTAVATVTVIGVNDEPTAVDDNVTTDEDTAVTFDVVADDPDASDDLTVTSASVTSGQGVATIAGDESITYNPGQAYQHLAVGESATVEITYEIDDGQGGTSIAVTTVTVNGVNDAPTAVPDSATTNEDTAKTIDVLANDTDPDASDTLTVTGAAVTSGGGTVSVGADGRITYDPGEAYQHLAAGESATVEITYDISDGHLGTSSAVATVTVNGVNDDPTAHADEATTDENSAVAIDVLANDTDPDDTDELTVTAASVPAGSGSVSVGADGIITYDPGQDFQHLAVDESATVEITYDIDDGNGGTSSEKVIVTVTGVNDGPTAHDDEATTDEDSPVGIDVLANDTDPDDSDELTVTGASVTSGGGSVTVGAGGILTYDPGQAYQHLAVDESATVTITYDIADGNGGTATADATVTVTGVNDGPTGHDDEATTDENNTVAIDVLANDTDPDDTDELTVTSASVAPGSGSVSIGAGGIITYDPGQDFEHLAVDEFAIVEITYDIDDGNGGTSTADATVTVWGVNDGPTAHDDEATTDEDSAVAIDVLANDTDPDDTDELTVTAASVPSGSVSVGDDGIITYDPGQDFQHLAVNESATVTITYDIADGNGGTSSAVAIVKVTGVNDAPTAVVDGASTDEDSAVSIDVLANDTDPDDTDELTVTAASVTSGDGSVDVEADGTLTYDPGQHYQHLAEDDFALVEITYDIADGNGGTSSAKAIVTVTGVNDAPVVSGEVSATASENAEGFNVDLLAGASDPDDGDTLNVTSLELVSGDAAGVTVSGNSLNIDPSAYNHLGAGETEVIRYSYQVTDAAGAVVAQTATITIEGATDIVWQIEQSDNSATANDGIIVEGDGATYTIAFSGDGDGSSLHGGESATVKLQFDPGSTESDDVDPAVGDDSTFWAAVFDALVAQGGTVDGDTVSIDIMDGDATVGVGTFDRSTGNLQVTADAGQTIDVGLPLVSFDLAAALDNGGGFESALVNQSNNGWGVSPDTHLDDGEGLFVEFLPTDIDTFTFDIEGFTANGSASFTVVGVDADGKPVAIKSTSNNAGVVGSVEGDRVQFTATANSSQVHSFTIVFAAAAVETVKIIGDGGNLQLRSFTGEDTASSTVIDIPSPVKSLDPKEEIVFQDDGVDVARMTAGTELPSAEPEDPEDFTISLVDVDQPGDVDDGVSATDSSVTTTIEDTGAPSSGSDPIVFDLGESGVELSASAAFDLNNDGDKQMLAWPGAEDGMLVMDLDGSGTIENGSEVFSPYFGEGGYADALEALESLDQNSDQLLNGDDAAFADLLVWIDGNSDGVSQPDELLGLDDLGVVEIDLAAQQVAYTIDDQNVLAEGLFSYGDGSTGQYLAVELDAAEPSQATAADSDSTGTVFALDGLSFGDVIADYGSGDVIDLTRLGFELATGQFTEAAAETFVRYLSPHDDPGDDDPQGNAGDLFVDPTGSGDFVLAAHVATAPDNVLVRLADEADTVQDVLIT